MMRTTAIAPRAAVFALCLLLPPAPAAAQQQQQFTVAQFLSAPFASELIAAPTAGRVAWVQNVLGARNIWVADGPDYKGRQLTRFTGDDGRYLVFPAFTPDGEGIVFVRGGAHSGTRLSEPPNPGFVPTGGTEEVWFVSLADGEAFRVDDGNWPSVSNRGDLITYVKRDQIWAAPLARTGGAVKIGAPRQLIRDRWSAAPAGNAPPMRWSPVGNRFSFVSRRDGYSFIGVYDADANTLAYLDPSYDRDQEPIWSPDGTRLAYIREPSTTGDLSLGAVRDAQPWSIRIAEVASGKGREIWRANSGVGSAFWNLLGNERQLFWGAGDRIVFPWERTGWLHLYAVSATGGTALALSSGEYEVEHVSMSPDRQELVFSSNQDDIDRRHLWRVSVAGGQPERVTSGTGIEYWPVFTTDGAALAFQSTGPRTPPQVELIRTRDLRGANGRPSRLALAPGIAPKSFPASALVEPTAVTFNAPDGQRIHGQLFLPANYRPGQRYPALVYLHGGSRAQMVLGYHYHRFDYYQKPYALIQYLANNGYIVMSVNYRSGTGYGMKFREALHYGADGASEVQDVVAGGRYLRGRPDVDADRVGIWGGSYGGYLTAMALATASDVFAAGFDLHGVHSWDARVTFSPFSGLSVAERARVVERARKSSPIGNVATWKSPVLFVQGDDDRNVHFDQGVAMMAALRKRDVDVEYLVLPNEIHSFLRHSSWERAFGAAADFFDRKLKNRQVRASRGKGE
jgi:dipeptidyl aminopeptidase/acylaminoacyl peptidase